jgi:hypothetical protein
MSYATRWERQERERERESKSSLWNVWQCLWNTLAKYAITGNREVALNTLLSQWTIRHCKITTAGHAKVRTVVMKALQLVCWSFILHHRHMLFSCVHKLQWNSLYYSSFKGYVFEQQTRSICLTLSNLKSHCYHSASHIECSFDNIYHGGDYIEFYFLGHKAG